MKEKNVFEKRIEEILSLIKRYEEGKITHKQLMDLYNGKKNDEQKKRKN